MLWCQVFLTKSCDPLVDHHAFINIELHFQVTWDGRLHQHFHIAVDFPKAHCITINKSVSALCSLPLSPEHY